MREGLPLLEEHELQVTRLRESLEEGKASGPAEPFDFDAFSRPSAPAREPPARIPHWRSYRPRPMDRLLERPVRLQRSNNL